MSNDVLIALLGVMASVTSAWFAWNGALAKVRVEQMAASSAMEVELVKRLDGLTKESESRLRRDLSYYGDMVEELRGEVGDLEGYVEKLVGIMRSHGIEVPPRPVPGRRKGGGDASRG